MPYYTLALVDQQKTLHMPARDADHALSIFGAELKQTLTLTDTDEVAPYLMDEFFDVPHWTNPTIPVYVVKG
jgi:hypothetical protein